MVCERMWCLTRTGEDDGYDGEMMLGGGNVVLETVEVRNRLILHTACLPS